MVAPVNDLPTNFPEGLGERVTWTPLTESDDGDAWIFAGSARGGFQVTGNFGTGGTVALQGSNDNTNWATVEDTAGNAISLTAAGIAAFDVRYAFYRAQVTAGTGVSVTARAFVRYNLAGV